MMSSFVHLFLYLQILCSITKKKRLKITHKLGSKNLWVLPTKGYGLLQTYGLGCANLRPTWWIQKGMEWMHLDR